MNPTPHTPHSPPDAPQSAHTHPHPHPFETHFDEVSELPVKYPLHIIIPVFGAFNIFLIAFIAVWLT